MTLADYIAEVRVPEGSDIIGKRVRDLDEVHPRVLAGTEQAQYPFWSPDGSEIGWFQNARMWKARSRGGRPVALCETPGSIRTRSTTSTPMGPVRRWATRP